MRVCVCPHSMGAFPNEIVKCTLACNAITFVCVCFFFGRVFCSFFRVSCDRLIDRTRSPTNTGACILTHNPFTRTVHRNAKGSNRPLDLDRDKHPEREIEMGLRWPETAGGPIRTHIFPFCIENFSRLAYFRVFERSRCPQRDYSIAACLYACTRVNGKNVA